MPSFVGEEDRPMDEAALQVNDDDTAVREPIIEVSNNRIRMLAGATETAASFEIEDEDHTLGNALRYIIMRNPDVELCGYSIPHPSEAKMNLRIQTCHGTTAFEALRQGLDSLMELCSAVTERFTHSKNEFDDEANEYLDSA